MHSIVHLLVSSCLLLPAAGQAPAPDRSLPEPPWPDVVRPQQTPALAGLAAFTWLPVPSGDSGAPPYYLDRLLRQGNLELFYRTARRTMAGYGRTRFVNRSPQQFKEILWVCHLVAKAPLYPIDFTGKQRWDYRRQYDDDILTKRLSCARIRFAITNENAALMGVDQKQLGDLSARYCAAVLKSLRQAYADTMPEQVARLMKAVNKKGWNKAAHDNFDRTANAAEIRNHVLPGDIKLAENNLVLVLTEYFPGRTAEAHRYIKLAGYRDSEINDLTDRTAEKNPGNGFLYKGGRRKTR